MFSSFSSSWALLGECYQVLKKQKTLLLLPIFSGTACLLIMASFAAPFFLFPQWGEQMLKAADQENPAGGLTEQITWFALLFAFYLVNFFIIVYFNTALAACAIVHFKGGTPTLGDGLAAATRRLPQILAWAFLAATVGMLLKALEERLGWLGQIVIRLVGMAWAIATFMVVPVLAVEGLGPVEALKRSVGLLRKSWGETLVGKFGLGLAGFLFMIPGFGLVMFGVTMLANGQDAVGFVLLGLGVVWIIGVGLVMATLSEIYRSALYLYAAERQLAPGFSPELIEGAFQEKRKK